MLASRLKELQASLLPLRDRLVEHEVYSKIDSPKALQVFLEHHIFAVWDFMSLLKALQRSITCVELPWVPKGDRESRRLINEIVLGEESDQDGRGGFASHFELYLEAMRALGANLGPIQGVLKRLERGEDLLLALDLEAVPGPSRDFVRTTWEIIESDSTPAIAAAFALGREELIPDMFLAVVRRLREHWPDRLEQFQDYLERHIALDADEHTPMALRMLSGVCGDNPDSWKIAEAAAQRSLKARLALWDGVLAQINQPESMKAFR